jgi:uridine kinase
MLDFRERTEEEILHSITDKVITTVNSKNTLPLDVNALAVYPNEHYRPTQENIQDIILNVQYDNGFDAPGDAYLFFRSLRGLIRKGELTEQHMLFHGFPSEQTFNDTRDLYKQSGADSIASINEMLRQGKPFIQLIQDFTEFYDWQLDQAAEAFKAKKDVKAIIITGKSSSGKTTTTHRFCYDRLGKLGLRMVPISVDNYFKPNSPKDPHGDMNYELPESLDLNLIRDHFARLASGEKIEMPKYLFGEDKRIDHSGKFVQLEKEDIVVIDSHYGLFPNIRNMFNPENVFIIYLEPLNMIKEEEDRNIHMSRYNMLRRWLRDKRTRGAKFEYNIPHWKTVRIGELRDIVPRMKLSDCVINSGFPFELNYMAAAFTGDNELPDPSVFLQKGRLYGAIKAWQAKNLLSKMVPVPKDYFDPKILPDYSILREFVGGSKYDTK